MYYDVFNGDADGICALHQLRLAEPKAARLISGVKRDIALLKKLSGVCDAVITVLDVSLEKNLKELNELLLRNCTVVYIDHHFSGTVPSSPQLTAHIDPDPQVCTSIIVDRLLEGRFRGWAVVGAFGDNLMETADSYALSLSLSAEETARLKELGELMNYNSYGSTIVDLLLSPQDMYEAVKPFRDPFDFLRGSKVLDRLRSGYEGDMARAMAFIPEWDFSCGRVYRFPAEPWSKRVAGVFINERARTAPGLAHALLVDNGDSTFLISVRAPYTRKTGADTLCRRFPTGGGRAAAAGVNALPTEMVSSFLAAFEEIFKS